MTEFNWDNINLSSFYIDNIENKVIADKLFVNLLMEIERQGIDVNKEFTIDEITKLIPKGTSGVDNHSTYGFSIMSMLSGQKGRDYFVFKNEFLRDYLTDICNNNNRDNYYWKKNCLNEILNINPKYIVDSQSGDNVAGKNEKKFLKFMGSVYGNGCLKGKCTYNNINKTVSISVDNSIVQGNKKVLIEVDSGNMAKLIVGQYTLLSKLCNEKDMQILFLVIHYYKDYNSQRTINNLDLVNGDILNGTGLKYKVFHIDDFIKFCKKNPNIKQLIDRLYS